MPNTNCLEGIRCPQCEQEDRFRISCMIDAIVTDDGAEPADNNHWDWDETSATSCPECGHFGQLKEFRAETEGSHGRHGQGVQRDD